LNPDFLELTAEQEELIDRQLDPSQDTDGIIPEGWVHLSLAVPKDFYTLFQETLAKYMVIRETYKVFPAFEAMVIEARNSLPG
jgi:hypothetical protein